MRLAGMAFPVYPSGLTAEEWPPLVPLTPAVKPHGRPGSVDVRRIGNGAWMAPGRELVRSHAGRGSHAQGGDHWQLRSGDGQDLHQFVNWQRRESAPIMPERQQGVALAWRQACCDVCSEFRLQQR